MQQDEVRSGGSYLSQSDLRIHFGLAGHEKVDKLEIFWPSGKVETLTNLGADHFYILKEEGHGQSLCPDLTRRAGILDKLLSRSVAAAIFVANSIARTRYGSMGKRKRDDSQPDGPVSLKTLAAYLNLDPTTISVVLNDVPGRSIPEATRERIRKAALKFNYQPSFLARSLRNRRTMTIGILVPVLADGYHAEVMTGIGDRLLDEKYFYFIAHHRHRPDLIEQYPRMLISRGAEGLIAIDTNLVHKLPLPVVAIAGHRRMSGVTNVVLDHHRAAELSLCHLYNLGHRTIAFMRGQPYSSDSDARWQGIVQVAQDLGLSIRPEMTIQLEKDLTSPELGYPVVEAAAGSPSQLHRGCLVQRRCGHRLYSCTP